MRPDSDDLGCRAVPPKDGLHLVLWRIEVVLVANEDETGFPREHVDNVRDDGLAVNFNERFGQAVAGFSETFPETGHGNDDLHN